MASVAPAADGEPAVGAVATTIRLSDAEIEILGDGARAEGSTVSITAGGVYEITGQLTGGQLLIDAPDEAKVELILAGVEIVGGKNAAIYAMHADDLKITLAEGTQNVLTDAATYVYADMVSEEPNATLFSVADLSIGGSGALTVNAGFNNGISSKEDIVIDGGQFTIKAANHGIRGRDSVTVLGGSFQIEAGGNYTIQANGDGVQAETELTISGGTYRVTTSGSPHGDSTSQKSLKAGTALIVSGGDFQLNTIDDGIHSDRDLQINAGNFTIRTSDDGVHADDRLEINGGTIDIPECYEGLDAAHLVITGGEVNIASSDDGISVPSDNDPTIEMSGGRVTIQSNDDGIDINGYGHMYLSGGTLVIGNDLAAMMSSPFGMVGNLHVTCGTMFGAGNGPNMQMPTGNTTQPTLGYYFARNLPEGTAITIKRQDDTELFAYAAAQDVHFIEYSSPELAQGETYIIDADGRQYEVTLHALVTVASEDGNHALFDRWADYGFYIHNR